MVCIDDFAIKKREKYGTIMIDINSHRVIDMINSRDQVDVVKWLKSFPNIIVFSRDGSITYHNSISESHPSAIQVSDPFHLLKNLTGYAIEYLKKELAVNIPININKHEISSIIQPENKAARNRKLTLSEKYEIVKKLLDEGKTQSQLCSEVNMDVRSYKKLTDFSEDERKELFTTTASLKHENKISQKILRVNEVRELLNSGYSKRKISRKTGLSISTVNKYIDEKFNPVHASFGQKKQGKRM